MSERSPKLLMEDILQCSGKIINYSQNLSYDEFTADEKCMDAVIRNFEIIGEAANRLPEEIRNQFSNVDWFRIKGFRNRIVHDYMGIDFEIVWNIKENFLPVLINQ